MGLVRKTLEQARADARIDQERLRATTEDDIRRYMIEDGEDPDAPPESWHPVISPAAIRVRLNLTQGEFAKSLKVPVKTLRNWEQGRTSLDPAVRSLLALVNDDPERAFKVLERS